jgi:molybdopterin/thiamine biosynthesis adenylyltransferase
MSSWDRVERLIGANNLAVLAAKKVVVVGCGSGGGYAALSLAMSGVGKFVLIDDDLLEESNITRHVADRRYLGALKADAVAELIHHRNPHAHIETRIGRVEQHLDALDEVDLLVSGVDGENSKYILNEACLERKLTAIYAGVYERGEGGDVTIIRPYDGPCYACWAAQLRDELGTVKAGENAELDYGMIGAEGTLEAEPGLWLHVTRVAGTQADIALNELLRDTNVYRAMPGNTVILANTPLEIIDGQMSFPYTAVWATIARNPHCLVCGDGINAAESHDEEQAALSLEDLMSDAGLELDQSKEE